MLITSNRFEGHNTSAIFFADVDEDFPGPASAIRIGRAGVRVRGNRALANGKVGIHLGPESDDALVTGNTAIDNSGDTADPRASASLPPTTTCPPATGRITTGTGRATRTSTTSSTRSTARTPASAAACRGGSDHQ